MHHLPKHFREQKTAYTQRKIRTSMPTHTPRRARRRKQDDRISQQLYIRQQRRLFFRRKLRLGRVELDPNRVQPSASSVPPQPTRRYMHILFVLFEVNWERALCTRHDYRTGCVGRWCSSVRGMRARGRRLDDGWGRSLSLSPNPRAANPWQTCEVRFLTPNLPTKLFVARKGERQSQG